MTALSGLSHPFVRPNRGGGGVASGAAVVGLLLLAFEAAYVLVWSAQCQEKLDSVYPDASKGFPGVVAREVDLRDPRQGRSRADELCMAITR